jgi:hypothetical protein
MNKWIGNNWITTRIKRLALPKGTFEKRMKHFNYCQDAIVKYVSSSLDTIILYHKMIVSRLCVLLSSPFLDLMC